MLQHTTPERPALQIKLQKNYKIQSSNDVLGDWSFVFGSPFCYEEVAREKTGKETEMIQTKTKRIVWTMAVVIALSFVAAMVLHKHKEPKVVGEFSQLEISTISENNLKFLRDYIKNRMHADWKKGEFRKSLGDISDYLSIRVMAIEKRPKGLIVVTLETARSKIYAEQLLRKKGEILDSAFSTLTVLSTKLNPPTNTAPVFQSGVGK